jgi:glucose/arabinose dehydrogenase
MRLFPVLLLAPGLAVLPLSAQDSDGSWREDAPGKRHEIRLSELPVPFATESARNGPRIVSRPEGARPQVPAGFEIAKIGGGFQNPRYLRFAPNGDLFVVESGANEIRVLRDTDNDGSHDVNEVFAFGLNQPFGIAFYPPGPEPQYLYIANTDSVIRLPYKNGDLHAEGKPEEICQLSGGGHLTGGGHWTRDLAFSKDGSRLFVSIGSLTNVNEENKEEETRRARIFVMNPDGSDIKTYATGIRNAVGIAVHPVTGDLWMSVNERDGLGDDLVPDYITRVKEGGFYGWPWFYLGKNLDPRHKANPHPELADTVLVPDIPVRSHSASLCLTFYTGGAFPKEYRNDAFAAFHGSWNRELRTGYKVVRVPLQDGKPQGYYEDFVTGFVTEEGDVWGRPVGLAVGPDGALYLSEDGNNTLWRITAKQK